MILTIFVLAVAATVLALEMCWRGPVQAKVWWSLAAGCFAGIAILSLVRLFL